VTTVGGLLVGGVVHPIDGVEVLNPLTTSWAKLGPEDYKMRRTSWVRQFIWHTTKGIWPQHVIPGAGPGGKDKILADFFRGDPEHSASQLGIDDDGSIVCLCDLATIAAHHATVSNDHSVGIEIYQRGDGGIYAVQLATVRKLGRALSSVFDVPYQVHTRPYGNAPLARMVVNGGLDCVGHFGHRDNTHRRGRGDPGDYVSAELRADDAESFDFLMREDINTWKRRQAWLNAQGAKLKVDGIAGPSTMRALRSLGLREGRQIPD
jgi:hypothetical protein